MTLAQAAAEADGLAMRGAERELAQIRSEWDEEIGPRRVTAISVSERPPTRPWASSASARSWSS